MKICVSLKDDHTLSAHFGESARFALLDSETGVQQPHSASEALCRGPCRCFLPESADAAFDLVICQAIGHRVLNDYRRRGIAVYQTNETDPVKAWQQWRNEQLAAPQRSLCLKGRRKPSSPFTSAIIHTAPQTLA